MTPSPTMTTPDKTTTIAMTETHITTDFGRFGDVGGVQLEGSITG